AFIILCLWLKSTGFLHLDGLADLVDGLAASHSETANNDKTNTSANFIVFDINISTTVYIAYDIRLAAPSWLGSWSNTGLILEDSDTSRILYSKNFAAGVVSLDGNEGNGSSSMYTVIVKDPLGSVILPDATPIAVNDTASTDTLVAVNIDVLENDSGLDDGLLMLSIVDQPSAGSAMVEMDNTITYTPDGSTSGVFSFTYQIIDNDGDMSTANVSVDVLCGSCANDVDLMLSWDANPVEENIIGYKLFYRVNSDVTSKLLVDIPLSQSGFDAANPSYTINAGLDMGLSFGDDVCLSIQAYNLAGSSESSDEICTTI
ncbi:MAG: adenosylcobinamide-GDP ribazoletransferase, partial [Thiomicrorhabdus sp.]|nr:adenosylcobinamide-GDP ribazoletransferase [Thiomicrorhabdus sp.]